MSRLAGSIAPVVAVAVLLLLALVVSPYRLGLLALVAAYAVASLAQNLLSGYADVPSLGNVAFFATSAYVAGALISQGRVSVALALLLGVLAAGLAGLIAGLPALRVGGMHFAVVTVALVFVTQELMNQWDQGHNANGVGVTGPSWLLDDRALYVAAILVSSLAYLAVWNLLRSRSGRAILAISDNPYAATASGIDSARYRLLAFVLSGLLTGLAGIVYLYYARNVTPLSFTIDLSLAFLTMIILGGSRSLGGSVLGALIIGLLPQLLNTLPSHLGKIDVQGSATGLYALLLLLTLRLFPEGIWNAFWHRLRRRGDIAEI